jgi:hypothetical protein
MKEPKRGIRRGITLAGMSAGIAGSYLSYLAQRPFLGDEKREEKKRATHSKAAKRMRDDMLA